MAATGIISLLIGVGAHLVGFMGVVYLPTRRSIENAFNNLDLLIMASQPTPPLTPISESLKLPFQHGP